MFSFQSFIIQPFLIDFQSLDSLLRMEWYEKGSYLSIHSSSAKSCTEEFVFLCYIEIVKHSSSFLPFFPPNCLSQPGRHLFPFSIRAQHFSIHFRCKNHPFFSAGCCWEVDFSNQVLISSFHWNFPCSSWYLRSQFLPLPIFQTLLTQFIISKFVIPRKKKVSEQTMQTHSAFNSCTKKICLLIVIFIVCLFVCC